MISRNENSRAFPCLELEDCHVQKLNRECSPWMPEVSQENDTCFSALPHWLKRQHCLATLITDLQHTLEAKRTRKKKAENKISCKWVSFSYHTVQQLLRTLFEELPCIRHMCAGSDEGPKKPPRFQLQPTHPYPHPAKQIANTNSHFLTCCLGFRVIGDNQALETRFFTHPPKHWVSKTTTEELGFPYLAKSKDPPQPMFQRGSLPMCLLL